MNRKEQQYVRQEAVRGLETLRKSIKKAKKQVETDPKKCVVYLRVSTDEQHLGPEAQLEACRQYAKRNDLELVEVCSDTGVSGAAPLDECRGLQTALDTLAVSRAGVLLVAKRDRLGRDIMKVGMVTRLVESNGARVHSADGVSESSEPTAVLLRNIIDAFSQFELALIKARTKAALAAKKARGEVVGAVPVGYRREGTKLVRDEEAMTEARAVQERARKLVHSGYLYREVIEEFRKFNVVYRNVEWKYPAQIQRVLELQLD